MSRVKQFLEMIVSASSKGYVERDSDDKPIHVSCAMYLFIGQYSYQ